MTSSASIFSLLSYVFPIQTCPSTLRLYLPSHTSFDTQLKSFDRISLAEPIFRLSSSVLLTCCFFLLCILLSKKVDLLGQHIFAGFFYRPALSLPRFHSRIRGKWFYCHPFDLLTDGSFRSGDRDFFFTRFDLSVALVHAFFWLFSRVVLFTLFTC